MLCRPAFARIAAPGADNSRLSRMVINDAAGSSTSASRISTGDGPSTTWSHTRPSSVATLLPSANALDLNTAECSIALTVIHATPETFGLQAHYNRCPSIYEDVVVISMGSTVAMARTPVGVLPTP